MNTNKKFYPTRAQSDYIINYHEVTPMLEGERYALVGWFEESNLKQNSIL